MNEDPDMAVLDEPLDRRGIAELLEHRGLARSTRRLLVALTVLPGRRRSPCPPTSATPTAAR